MTMDDVAHIIHQIGRGALLTEVDIELANIRASTRPPAAAVRWQTHTYRIAGNFRVQIFVFFEDAQLSTKLKYRPSSTSKTAARELPHPIVQCMHANSNEMDAKLAS